MVEFTIILPLLLLLVFMILEFGLLFGRWLTISNAAREGARVAVVFRDSCVATDVQNEAVAAVTNYAASMGVILAPTDVSVVGHCDTGFNSTTTVTATNTYSFLVVQGLFKLIRGSGDPSLSINLTGESTMRNEGTG